MVDGVLHVLETLLPASLSSQDKDRLTFIDRKLGAIYWEKLIQAQRKLGKKTESCAVLQEKLVAELVAFWKEDSDSQPFIETESYREGDIYSQTIIFGEVIGIQCQLCLSRRLTRISLVTACLNETE